MVLLYIIGFALLKLWKNNPLWISISLSSQVNFDWLYVESFSLINILCFFFIIIVSLSPILSKCSFVEWIDFRCSDYNKACGLLAQMHTNPEEHVQHILQMEESIYVEGIKDAWLHISSSKHSHPNKRHSPYWQHVCCRCGNKDQLHCILISCRNCLQYYHPTCG